MNNPLPVVARPPLGCIVEGHGEYYAYPSLVARIVGHALHVPVLNAGGYGGITRNFEKHLVDIVLTHHPYAILATVDLKDVTPALYDDCQALKTDLVTRAKGWYRGALEDPRLSPLPEDIEIVIQVPKFEAWLLAGEAGLIREGYLDGNIGLAENVDSSETDPATLLRANINGPCRIKNPRDVKQLVACVDPTEMRARSRSFDKFFREASRLYATWEQACAIS